MLSPSMKFWKHVPAIIKPHNPTASKLFVSVLLYLLNTGGHQWVWCIESYQWFYTLVIALSRWVFMQGLIMWLDQSFCSSSVRLTLLLIFRYLSGSRKLEVILGHTFNARPDWISSWCRGFEMVRCTVLKFKWNQGDVCHMHVLLLFVNKLFVYKVFWLTQSYRNAVIWR